MAVNFKLLREKPNFNISFIIADGIISLIFVIGVIIYTKLNFYPRCICYICVIIFAIMFLLLVIGFFLVFHLNVIEYQTHSSTSESTTTRSSLIKKI
jgi:hypothetical protein